MVTPDSGLRVVFFGTPDFAVPSLERLVTSAHRVVTVVTQPDRPRGRGQRTAEPAVKRVARALGLPVLQPDRLRDPDFHVALSAHGPDLGVVAAYGRILPESLLQLPRLGMINVHASLLPLYRGAAPVHRAVMAGERETGVTIMRVVRELDAGPMLAVASRAIDPDETSEQVERDLARLGADLMIQTVDALATGRAQEVPQDDALATHAPRLTRADGVIDWSRPALALHNQVRGLHPWPHAHTYLDGRRYLVLRTQVGGEPVIDNAPGTIVQARGEVLAVAAGEESVLRILEIQPEGRRPMSARDFLAGHRVTAGAVFQAEP